MKRLGLEIITSVLPPVPIADKNILWSAQSRCGDLAGGDFSRFPHMEAITTRFYSLSPSPLHSFSVAVANAQERVWIIDHYFLDPDTEKDSRANRVQQIINWFLESSMLATDIRIFTDMPGERGEADISPKDAINEFQACADLINSERKNLRHPPCTIAIRFDLDKLFPYIHDRFAIIDDELWHFGATVGGFHAQVSAATRGWRASDYRAEEFFKDVWNYQNKGRAQK